MRNYNSHRSNRNVYEARASLYRSQNKSVLVSMVWLIGLAALALGVVVLAGQLGIF